MPAVSPSGMAAFRVCGSPVEARRMDTIARGLLPVVKKTLDIAGFSFLACSSSDHVNLVADVQRRDVIPFKKMRQYDKTVYYGYCCSFLENFSSCSGTDAVTKWLSFQTVSKALENTAKSP